MQLSINTILCRSTNQLTGRKIISALFGLICALLPFLYIVDYAVSSLTLEKLVLIILGLVSFISLLLGKIRVKPSLSFLLGLLFLIYLTINAIFNSSCGLFGIASSWIILLFAFFIGCSSFFSFSAFKNTVVFISFISAILVFIQYISYYVLHSYISFIPTSLYREGIVSEYGLFLINGFDYGGGMLRPSAFFIEPAHMAEYCLLGLLFIISSKSKRSLVVSIIVSLGIVMTTSGIGILGVVILWLFKLLLVKGFKKVYAILGMLVLGVLFFVVLDAAGILSSVLSRFSFASSRSGFSSRFSDVNPLFDNLTYRSLLFGEGFDSETSYWLPGFFSLIRQLGIVGLSLFVFLVVSLFKKNKFNIMFIALYFYLLIVSEVSALAYFVFYLCFTCRSDSSNNSLL